MASYIINGPAKNFGGSVRISGSKNSALPIMAAAMLCPEKSVLYNLPRGRGGRDHRGHKKAAPQMRIRAVFKAARLCAYHGAAFGALRKGEDTDAGRLQDRGEADRPAP